MKNRDYEKSSLCSTIWQLYQKLPHVDRLMVQHKTQSI